MASDQINRVQHFIPHVLSSNSFSHEDWKKMCRIAELLEVYNKEGIVPDELNYILNSQKFTQSLWPWTPSKQLVPRTVQSIMQVKQNENHVIQLSY